MERDIMANKGAVIIWKYGVMEEYPTAHKYDTYCGLLAIAQRIPELARSGDQKSFGFGSVGSNALIVHRGGGLDIGVVQLSPGSGPGWSMGWSVHQLSIITPTQANSPTLTWLACELPSSMQFLLSSFLMLHKGNTVAVTRKSLNPTMTPDFANSNN
ncbi:hypothetical protein STEG23_022298, partial [Scotinomys teguina]